MDINSFFVLKINKIKEFQETVNYNGCKEIIKLEYKTTIYKNIQKYQYISILHDKLEIKDYYEVNLMRVSDNRIIAFANSEILIKKIQNDFKRIMDSDVDIENINLQSIIEKNTNISVNKYLVKEKDIYFIDSKIVKNFNEIKEKIIGLQALLKIKNKTTTLIILNKCKIKFSYSLYEEDVIDLCKEMKIIV